METVIWIILGGFGVLALLYIALIVVLYWASKHVFDDDKRDGGM